MKLPTIFKRLSKRARPLKITHLLGELFKQADAQEISIIANLSLGQLHAPYLGKQFNMADKNLIKIIIADLLHETEHTIAQELKLVGDLGIIVGAGTWQAKKELSVNDVYVALNSMQQISGTGSQEEKSIYLVALLNDLDPLSAKYVVRIILDNLRLGFSDMTMIDALSWMEAGNKSLRAVTSKMPIISVLILAYCSNA